MDVRFYLHFPAVLQFTEDGEIKVFDFPNKAKHFLNEGVYNERKC